MDSFQKSNSEDEKFRLEKLVYIWNSNHDEVELLEPPNKNLRIRGVVRIDLKDIAGAELMTKCVPVTSIARTRPFRRSLIRRFYLDVNSVPENVGHRLYLVSKVSGEQKLPDDAFPLLELLNLYELEGEGSLLLKEESLQELCSKSNTDLTDDCRLPLQIKFDIVDADRLLQAITLELNIKPIEFELTACYTIYLAVRHQLLISRASDTHNEHNIVTDFVNEIAKLISKCVEKKHNDPPALVFWMTNASEILHMFKQDRDIQPLSVESQQMLSEAVQMAFHHLVRCFQGDLQRVLPAFLDCSDDNDEEKGQGNKTERLKLADVLKTLTDSFKFLRRCRVNVVFTIQIFSHVFHLINSWLFNIIVTDGHLKLCTRRWGSRLKKRLGEVEAWAEQQGLELASDCHLATVVQAAHLLQAPKHTSDDITNISSTCFKLNSLQIRALLTRYVPEDGEPQVPSFLIDRAVAIAEKKVDEGIRKDRREVRLKENPEIDYPFLLPDEYFSCDTLKSIPNGFLEFLRQLEQAGLCSVVLNSFSSGDWNVFMGQRNLTIQEQDDDEDEDEDGLEIVYVRKSANRIGLLLASALRNGMTQEEFYIKAIVDNSTAAMSGQLEIGDQVLEVDGTSLAGFTIDGAVDLLKNSTSQIVKLKIFKHAAFHHNVARLLELPFVNKQKTKQEEREIKASKENELEDHECLIKNILLRKCFNRIGLLLASAVRNGKTQQEIYIKNIVDKSAAAMNGELEIGDQVLEVDGISLTGYTHEGAVELLKNTGDVVNLKIAKQAAFHYNLVQLLGLSAINEQKTKQEKKAEGCRLENVTLVKSSSSIGLLLSSALRNGATHQEFYIKDILDNSTAAKSGQLEIGDQVLEVDGTSLAGFTHREAVNLLKNTGRVIKLKIAKQAAFHHNVAQLLGINKDPQ